MEEVIAAEKERIAQLEAEEDEFEDNFTRIDKSWVESVRSKFKELGVGEKAFEEYQEMRQSFERDALSKLESFHQAMEKEKGKNYTYRITEFDDKVMNDLRKEYHERLAKLIGKEATREFIALRDEFNEKLRLDQEDVSEDFTIDF